jgi:hypothetical protein
MTNCGLYTFGCVAKSSLESLFSGPFKREHIENNIDKVKGPKEFISQLLTSPYALSPVLDLGIHIRNQLHQFEAMNDPSSGKFKDVVSNYIQSDIVNNLVKNIVMKVANLKHIKPTSTIYISSDLEEFKAKLSDSLLHAGYSSIIHSEQGRLQLFIFQSY